MVVAIYQSTKFKYSVDQYYAVACGHTLLRLTYGSFEGRSGGAIKTATASDNGAEPVYGDRDELTAAMCLAVQKLGGRARDVIIEVDGKGRQFAEITFEGTRDELVEALAHLAEQMEHLLTRSSKSVHDRGYSDLRDLYDDLCVVEGHPVYLSDGVYLDPDSQLSA